MRGLPIFLLILLLVGCKTHEPIVVHDVHTEYKTKIDTFHRVDSFFKESNTIIREVDSATMAQFGIQLEGQKAWLIKQLQQQKQSNSVQHTVHDTIVVTDSIPVPYKVVEEKKLTFIQKSAMSVGYISLFLIIMFLLIFCLRKAFLR